MGYVEQIYQTGDDALDNEFDVVIAPISVFNLTDPFRFRTTSVTIPGRGVNTYAINYKTIKITKPSGSLKGENVFNIEVRIDKYWTLYQALLAWKNAIADEITGAMAEDVNTAGVSANRTDIIVMSIDANGVQTGPGWKFHKCFISDIPSVTFNQGDGGPMPISVEFNFLKMTS